MRRRMRWALVPAGVLALMPAAVVLGAKPSGGRTYSGDTAHGKRPITLKVSKNGKAVTDHVKVGFTVAQQPPERRYVSYLTTSPTDPSAPRSRASSACGSRSDAVR